MMKKYRSHAAICAIFAFSCLFSNVWILSVHAAAVTADDIERQIMTYRAPEKNVEAQTYTSFLCPCLAFRWKGEGTPAGAVIGEHSLTENSEKLPDEYHDAPYQIQSVKTMAALLPSKIEAYDESTFDVPEELLQSDIWLITGAGSQESAKSILNDERIEACGIMYVSQLKYTDYDAFENPVTGETEYHPQDISLDNLHVSLELVPLRHYAYGDTDGDGEVNLTDANAALLYYNLATVAMADEADYNLTPYEAKAADVNQDGIVDTKDANAIMLYYNCTAVSQVDGITWYDILKISGVPGAPE